jgi:ComEC/Rec2-related protein
MSPVSRRRLPCLGIFVAASVGTVCSMGHPDDWLIWLTQFLAMSIMIIWLNHWWYTLCALFCFFGFWNGFLIATDQGYLALQHLAGTPQIHSFTLQVCSNPTSSQRGKASKSQRFFAQVMELDNEPAHFLVEISVPDHQLQYGDQLQVDGRLKEPAHPLNPGQFNYNEYLKVHHIYLELVPAAPSTISVTSHGHAQSLTRLLIQFKEKMETALGAGIDDSEASETIRGIVFGDRHGMSPELNDLLQRTGLLHLFVVDGLKVTLFAGLSWVVARLCKLGPRSSALVALPILAAYCLMTGFTAASLRATLMCTLLFAGISLERPLLTLNTLAAAATTILLVNPLQLFEAGFQLSFVVVLAIVICVRPLAEWLAHPIQPDPFIPSRLLHPWHRSLVRFGNRLFELLSLSIVCWLASFPILALQFHRISLTSVLANFVLVPVGTWILVIGVISLLFVPVCSWIQICLNNTNWLLVKVFLFLAKTSTLIPWDNMNIASPSLESPPTLTALATGRAMVFHFHVQTTDWLLNTGNDSQWQRITGPYLRYRGINRISGVLLDHNEPKADKVFSWAKDRFYCNNWVNLTGKSGSSKKTFHPIREADASGFELPSFLQHPTQNMRSLIYEVNGFRFLIGTHLTSAEMKKIGPVDVVFVSGLGKLSLDQIEAYLHPQIVVSEYKVKGPEQESSKLWILPRDGAIECFIIEHQCTLKAFGGKTIALRRPKV